MPATRELRGCRFPCALVRGRLREALEGTEETAIMASMAILGE